VIQWVATPDMIQWTDLQALNVAEGWQVLIWLEL
jgi:hypothetical protein